MSDKPIDDGGAAFPFPASLRPDPERVDLSLYDEGRPGMSLRDLFAKIAIGGCIASTCASADWPDPMSASAYAYRVADAMLVERAKASEGTPK